MKSGNEYAEKVTIGALAWKTYLLYFKTGGGIIGTAFFFTILIASQVFVASADYWINRWASYENKDYLDKLAVQRNEELYARSNQSCHNCTFDYNIPIFEERDNYYYTFLGNLIFKEIFKKIQVYFKVYLIND